MEVWLKLRGAISGFGNVAALGHLPGWRRRPHIEIVAVHEPVPARRHEALRLIKNVRVYEDLELMLDGEKLDFLDVASPPGFHVAAAEMALRAGVNVIVEKPLCLRLEDFERLQDMAAAQKKALVCVHNWKYAPPYKRALELTAQVKLGQLRYIRMVRMRTQQAGGAPWRINAGEGGGILVDHGWHVLYLMRALAGDVDPRSISATLFNGPDGAADAVADLSLRFEDGLIGQIHLSWLAPLRVTEAFLYGHDGVLAISGDSMSLTTRAGEEHDLSVSDAPDDSYHAAWFDHVAAEFEKAIDKTSPGNLDEARSVLAMMIAARTSASQGGATVSLDRVN